MADDRKPIHPEIPTDIAWQTGRRIYVRTSSKSQLGRTVLDQGGHWDRTTTPWRLWVGSTKKADLIPLILDHLDRVTRIKNVLAAGFNVRIPVEDAETRAIAKRDHGAIFDGDTKTWFFPTYADMEAVRRRLGAPLWGLVEGEPDRTAPRREAVRDGQGIFVYPGEPGYEEALSAETERRAAAEAAAAARVAVSIYIPYEAASVDALARSLGAIFERSTKSFRMSTEAAAQVRPALEQWIADRDARARRKAEQECERLLAEAGRTAIPGRPREHWGTDQIGALGDVVIEGDRVYVLIDVSEEYDGPDDYVPAWTWGIEVYATDEDRAVIAYRAEEQAIAQERRALGDAFRKTGEAPEGHHRIAAEHLMSTESIYGHGDWFCLTDEYVWFVQNNGADGDNWAYNNIRTGGAGAIGWRVDRATPEGVAFTDRVLALVRRYAEHENAPVPDRY